MRVVLTCLVLLGTWCNIGFFPNAQGQSFLVPLVGHRPWGKRFIKLQHHRINVTIKGRMAYTTIEQLYRNPTARALEASYVFALPKGAVLSRLAMKINGKTAVGQVFTRQKAHRMYQSIVSKMRDPALLEYMGRSLYRVKIFPIPAHGRQKIKFSFVQLLPRAGGLFWYNYPLRPLNRQLRTTKDLSMTLRMRANKPIKAIYSPTHRVSIHRKGTHRAVVGFEQNQALLRRDFRLYFSVDSRKIGLSALHHKQSSGSKRRRRGYVMLALSPGELQTAKQLAPKQVTFVIDTSGSMLEQKRIYWAKQAIHYCLARLHRRDTFNVIGFATDLEPLFRRPKRATPRSIKRAKTFVDELVASGGTALEPALRKALRQPISPERNHLIIMLTDGEPTVGQTSTRGVLASLRKANRARKARIFGFGLGNRVNAKLLDQIAEQHGGMSEYSAHGFALKQRITHFFDKIRHPVLRDVRLSLKGNIRLYDQYPKTLPDIYRGGQLLLFGRYQGYGKGQIVVSGWLGKKRKRFVYPIHFPKRSLSHGFLRLLWAKRKMGYLLSALRNKPGNTELKKAVIQLGKTYQLVTPLTSMFAGPAQTRPTVTRIAPQRISGRHSTTASKPTQQPSAGSISHGSFSQSSGIMRTIRRKRRQLRWAFEKQLKRNPSLGGKIKLKLTINGQGRVSNVDVESDATNAPVGRSIARIIRRWRFPKPVDGKPVTIMLPLVFAPSSGNWRGYRASSGKQAIKSSKKLWSMKHSKRLNQGIGQGVKIVRGRRFVRKTHGWKDTSCPRPSKHLRIQYNSPLYYSLLRRQPALAPFLALGRVSICIGKRKALHIGDKGLSNQQSILRVTRFLK